MRRAGSWLTTLFLCLALAGMTNPAPAAQDDPEKLWELGEQALSAGKYQDAPEPAVEFMQAFYGHLQDGKSRAEALRLSRKAMQAKYPHPFYWAVFILHGEG